MGTATWYCLQMDSSGPGLGEFWAQVLGARAEPSSDEDVDVDLYHPDDGSLLMQVGPVPEPKTVKHRGHLDLRVRTIDELTDAGATVVAPQEETGFKWTVLNDPQGGEFCAFLKAEVPAMRLYDLVIDCRDPETMARWWAERFGGQADNEGTDPVWWVDQVPGMPFENLVFVPVPEQKTVKNRVHWDVWGDVAEFEAAGAQRLWEGRSWLTMADPEGNEFCVFTPTD